MRILHNANTFYWGHPTMQLAHSLNRLAFYSKYLGLGL